MRRSLTMTVAAVWLAAFAAGPAYGQAPAAVGIVTALSGGAEVVRAPGASPTPMAFRDRVLAGDAIATAEGSVVRVLLGGKALLTVRELSRVRVGPAPDRLGVTLESGRVALSVVAERLAPGESIEVRTPNGSARVQGGTVVVEATRASAQVGPGPLAMVSTISVIQGPTSVQVALTQAQMTANQTVMITGFILGPIRAMTPAMLAALARDLLMPLQHYESALKATVSQTQLDQAAALAAVLAAGPTADDRQFRILLSELEASLGPLTPLDTSYFAFQCLPDCHGELVSRRVGPNPWLILMGVFDDVTVDRPMLVVTSSIVDGIYEVFSAVGNVTSTTIEPLIRFNGSIVRALAFLEIHDTASLTLNGPLFEDTGGFYDIALSFLIASGTVTTTSTTAPLLRFTNSVVVNGELPNSLGGTFVFPRAMNLGGALVEASNSNITSAGALLNVTGSAAPASVTGTGPTGLFRFDGGALSVQAVPKWYDWSWAAFYFNYGDVNVIGPVLETTNTRLTFGKSVLAFESRDPLPTLTKGSGSPVLSITGPASFTHELSLNDPLVWIGLNVRWLARAPETDPDVLPCDGSPACGPGPPLNVSTAQPLRGPGPDGVLDAPVLRTDGASVKTQSLLLLDVATLAASQPILDLRNGSVFEATANLINVGAAAKLTSVGSLVRLDASTLRIGGAFVSVGESWDVAILKITGDLVTLGNGSTLRAGTLLSLGRNGVVSISGALVGFTTASGNTVTLTNTLCPCTTIGGIPVALTGGATAAQVSITGTPIKNLGTNSFNPTGGAVIRVDGTTSRVTVRGL